MKTYEAFIKHDNGGEIYALKNGKFVQVIHGNTVGDFAEAILGFYENGKFTPTRRYGDERHPAPWEALKGWPIDIEAWNPTCYCPEDECCSPCKCKVDWDEYGSWVQSVCEKWDNEEKLILTVETTDGSIIKIYHSTIVTETINTDYSDVDIRAKYSVKITRQHPDVEYGEEHCINSTSYEGYIDDDDEDSNPINNLVFWFLHTGLEQYGGQIF